MELSPNSHHHGGQGEGGGRARSTSVFTLQQDGLTGSESQAQLGLQKAETGLAVSRHRALGEGSSEQTRGRRMAEKRWTPLSLKRRVLGR